MSGDGGTGRRHIIPISGKDSLATALLQTAREPGLPYEYLFNDPGTELPETYAWLDRVEMALGAPIVRAGRDLTEIIRRKDVLPSSQMRFCTELAKIEPMERFIGRDPATIYFGLRADEPSRIGYRAAGNIRAEYPLREIGIDLRGVWIILEATDLLPPAFWWEAIYFRVLHRLGDGWQAEFQPWELRHLFAGRSRSNCYFCFFQRQYEFVWLAETHPDLFDRACWIERRHGGERFNWLRGMRLEQLLSRRDEIKDRRADDVVKTINRRLQRGLFTWEDSPLATTSCGLLCGK